MKIDYGGRPNFSPDIRPWIGRNFEEVNYYITQTLSGHEYFRKHLHRMGKTAWPYCLYEEGEIIDVAEHIFVEHVDTRVRRSTKQVPGWKE